MQRSTHARQGYECCISLTMASRTILPLVILFLGMSSNVLADDFWKHKPPAQWTSQEALKVVHRSPWAKVEVVVFLQQDAQADYSIPRGPKHCDPDAIDANGNCTQKGRIEVPVDPSRLDAAPQLSPSTGFLVRWESATPVIQAFARLTELGERSVVEFQAQAPRVPAERYVITVKLEQTGSLNFEPFAVTPGGNPTCVPPSRRAAGPLPRLKLNSSERGRVPPYISFFRKASKEFLCSDPNGILLNSPCREPTSRCTASSIHQLVSAPVYLCD